MKRKRIFHFCHSLHVDLVLLQECHAVSSNDRDLWSYEWGGPLFLSYGSSFSCGTAILVAPYLASRVIKVSCDTEGRLVCITLNLSSCQVQICNIYAPNQPSNRRDFFNKLSHFICGNKPCILAGDFNCVPDVVLDRKKSSSNTADAGIAELNDFVKINRMCDVWRVLNPWSSAFTWIKPDSSDASRLDRIYTALPVHFCKIVDCPLSDHNAIVGSFGLPKSSLRGKGFWKLNNKILSEDAFISLYTQCYLDWKSLKCAFDSLQEWWDEVKFRTKQLAIKYCVKRAKQQRSAFLRLCSRSHSKEDLECYLDDKFRGAKIRARVVDLEGEEQPSSAFYKLTASQLASKHIDAVRRLDGSVTTEPSDIVNVYRSFYMNLFSQKSTNAELQSTLLDHVKATPSDAHLDTLKSPLSLKDLEAALGDMKNNKSPGSDGLSKEFYQSFWDVIGSDLLEVFNACYEEGFLSNSQKEGIITLISKGGDDLEPSNKRPITLMNVDYKILAKVLSKRLAMVLPDLIGDNQTCSVKGHSIQQNLWLLRDLTYFAIDRNLPCAIVSLDQEKAFDRVDHAFLWKVLDKFNLDDTFKRWIKLLYNGAIGKVLVNGFISDPFPISSGVRQGCPLSPLLYVLCCEVLLLCFNFCENLKGFLLPGGLCVKCVAYADDISCFISDTCSFRALKTLLAHFELATGGKLNMSKTWGLRLGRWSHKSLPFNAKWCDDNLKINGIWFGNDNPIQKTWDDRFIKLQQRLQDFTGRCFTLPSKISIINCFILPILFYPGMVYPLPDMYVQRIEKLLFSFIWSHKTELVCRNMVYRERNEGGLGLLHFSSKLCFLRCRQIYDAVVNDHMPHSYFVRLYCGVALRYLFPPLFVASGPHVLDKPPYYSSVIQTFSCIRKEKEDLVFSETPLSCVYSILKGISLGPLKYRKDLLQLSQPGLWGSVNCPLFDNRLRDLSWRIAHNALVTNLKRKHWGLGDGMCPRDCHDFESICHIFWECTYVDDLWAWFQSIANVYCNWQVCKEFAIFGLSLPPCSKKEVNFLLLVAAYIRRRVWSARCKLVFENISLTPFSVLSSVKSDLILHIRTDFNRLNRSHFLRNYPTDKGCISTNEGILILNL